jgi:hypothetical protein
LRVGGICSGWFQMPPACRSRSGFGTYFSTGADAGRARGALPLRGFSACVESLLPNLRITGGKTAQEKRETCLPSVLARLPLRLG